MQKQKNLAILIIGRVLQIIIALVTIKVIVSVLSVEEVGNYYLLLALLGLLSFTLLNPLGQYYGRHLIT